MKQAKERFKPLNVPSCFIHDNVPYFAQWESRSLVKDILAEKMKAGDDPLWRQSGAKTKSEYADWSWSGCGMACLKMILAHAKKKNVPLVRLAKQCASYGGYKFPLKEHPGLYYYPFVKFVGQEYGLKATVVSPMTIRDIIRTLAERSYVIASVNPSIRTPRSPDPQQKSGHLILVVGYDMTKKIFLIHNPSGTEKSNQEYAEISFDDFRKFFGNRGIILYA